MKNTIIDENIRQLHAQNINMLIKQVYNIHLTTCGYCGNIVSSYNRIDHGNDDIECPICHYHGNDSDFPDLFT